MKRKQGPRLMTVLWSLAKFKLKRKAELTMIHISFREMKSGALQLLFASFTRFISALIYVDPCIECRFKHIYTLKHWFDTLGNVFLQFNGSNMLTIFVFPLCYFKVLIAHSTKIHVLCLSNFRLKA